MQSNLLIALFLEKNYCFQNILRCLVLVYTMAPQTVVSPMYLLLSPGRYYYVSCVHVSIAANRKIATSL
uniref:Predicted protein n=1 Tax=Hordeum vulgare subsp. vulgare TaxID=112509 RepID=F2CZ45_HORVV|nr:predicted protein [Hordeum vulgare subsp. vulgare]